MTGDHKPIFQNKLKNIHWQKIYTREYGVQYSQMMIMSVSPYARHIIPTPSTAHIVIPQNNNTAFYADKKSWQKLTKSLHDRYARNMNVLNNYEEKLLTAGKKYVTFTGRIGKLVLAKQSNQQLLNIYLKYQIVLFQYTVYVATAFILNNYIAEQAVTIVEGYLKKNNMENKTQEVVDSLFAPLKKAAILRLQYQIENFHASLSNETFSKLYQQYKWLSCQDLHNGPWTKTQFQQAIRIFKSRSVSKKISFQQYANILKMRKKDVDYLAMAKRMVYIKDARDDFRRRGIYNILPFFAEVALRMKIKSPDISFVLPSEIIDFLRNKSTPSHQIIANRKKGFVIYLDNKNGVVCLQGSNIKRVLAGLKMPKQRLDQIKIVGRAASRGKVAGVVVIVRGIKDLTKVTHNAILVATSTHPDYTMAMRKAAAIVTDEGGITSHAAIVAREYGIPCIVGVHNATKILNDGDRVIVDATAGMVTKVS